VPEEEHSRARLDTPTYNLRPFCCPHRRSSLGSDVAPGEGSGSLPDHRVGRYPGYVQLPCSLKNQRSKTLRFQNHIAIKRNFSISVGRASKASGFPPLPSLAQALRGNDACSDSSSFPHASSGNPEVLDELICPRLLRSYH
jgi:hypothetical protein